MNTMLNLLNRSARLMLATLVLALLPAAGAAAAGHSGAVVFSRAEVTTEEVEGTPVEKAEGGLYAARDGRLNQLTEDPSDREPDFSADGRRITFVRGGDVWAMRADGTGQHQLTSGPEVDGRPQFAPNGRYLVFERRAAGTERPRDLYTVRANGRGLHELVSFAEDLHEATFSPDGRLIAFVRSMSRHDGGYSDDIYSVRPSGAGLRRLTLTYRLDEFSPRYFRGGIVFSRGRSGEGPGAYADVFTMRRDGSRVRALIRGAGSSFVEDVAPARRLLLFRRDQGLWVKRIGRGRAHKLSEVADNSQTNSVFSFDGRRVAAFVAADDAETLSAIDVATRRRTQLASGFSLESGSVAASIGPVIAWQPVRR